ncbi:hypothetical protein CJ483_00225 [Bacillus sp. PK3_68]|nr:hypothetical protein CJ483_00225 [Bacillus sp. PK3_68]
MPDHVEKWATFMGSVQVARLMGDQRRRCNRSCSLLFCVHFSPVNKGSSNTHFRSYSLNKDHLSFFAAAHNFSPSCFRESHFFLLGMDVIMHAILYVFNQQSAGFKKGFFIRR